MKRGFHSQVASITLAVTFCYSLLLAVFSSQTPALSMNGNSFWPNLYDKPVGEDGFYMLTIAWNLAENGNFLYNFGDISTGIQPLMTVLMAAIARFTQFFGGNKEDFVRFIIALNGTLFTLFALIIGNMSMKFSEKTIGLERAIFAKSVAIVLTATSFFLFRTFHYGLETGLYLILLTILATILLSQQKSFGDSVKLGIVAGFTGLARIDFGVVFGIFLVAAFLFRMFSLLYIVRTGAIAFFVVLPWLVFVFLETGSIVPSSGGAQSALITVESFSGRGYAMILAISQIINPIIFVAGRYETFMLSVALIVGFVCWVPKVSPTSTITGMNTRQPILLFFAAFCVVPLIYFAMFWATHFYARYVSALSIFSITLLSTVIAERVSQVTLERLIMPVSLLVFFVFSFYSLHTGRLGNSHTVSAYFVAENFSSPDMVVGAFQSGVIGFLNENVINLDGKIDAAALDMLRIGRIDHYIEAREIDVIVDWPGYIGSISANYLEKNFVSCEREVPNGQSICLWRIP